MGEAQGKKVSATPLRLQAIEAQPSSGQISQGEAVGRTEQHPREKTWLTQKVQHKRAGTHGGEKWAVA